MNLETIPKNKWMTIRTIKKYGNVADIDKEVLKKISNGELELRIRTKKEYCFVPNNTR